MVTPSSTNPKKFFFRNFVPPNLFIFRVLDPGRSPKMVIPSSTSPAFLFFSSRLVELGIEIWHQKGYPDGINPSSSTSQQYFYTFPQIFFLTNLLYFGFWNSTGGRSSKMVTLAEIVLVPPILFRSNFIFAETEATQRPYSNVRYSTLSPITHVIPKVGLGVCTD